MTDPLYQWAAMTGRIILKVEEQVAAWVTYSSGGRVFRYRLEWEKL